MPNLMVAIQNAVNPRELGTATATSTFFRSLGGTFGVALSGAIMTAHLQDLPADVLSKAGSGPRALVEMGMQQIAQLPQAEREVIIALYRHAIGSTFLVGSVITAMALVLVLFLPEHPLRSEEIA
jgi:hypothetical protein